MAALKLFAIEKKMRLRAAAALFCILSLISFAVADLHAQSPIPPAEKPLEHSLYAQAAAAMLDRDFTSPRIEYWLIDAHSRETIAFRWAHAETPIAPGSLLKPFVALAFVRSEPGKPSIPLQLQARQATSPRSFPNLECHGRSDGCWSPKGHGRLGLEQALAVSCNAYFLALARDVAADSYALPRVSETYGLPSPPAGNTAPELIGVTPEWRITPLALIRAYAMLIDGAHSNAMAGTDPITHETLIRLRDGMKLAALPGGTAAKIGAHTGGVLAKTGTAACVPEPMHAASEGGSDGRCRVNGDGLVILAAPADDPQWLLLVRERGTTGAMTAQIAGVMLTKLEEADGAHR